MVFSTREAAEAYVASLTPAQQDRASIVPLGNQWWVRFAGPRPATQQNPQPSGPMPGN
jgi:hypothetical protein